VLSRPRGALEVGLAVRLTRAPRRQDAPLMAPCCRIPVKAIPNASRDAVVGWFGDALKVKVRAPALDGRANESLCELLAGELGIPARAVEVLRGAKSRLKVVEIRGLTPEEVRARLAC
jgi:uncharacterized protein